MRKLHTEKYPGTCLDMKSEGLFDWRFGFSDIIDKFSEAGAALRGFRLRDRLTQVQLAEKVGINQANLSKMEHGKRPIGKAMAKKFAALFHTDYRIFL